SVAIRMARPVKWSLSEGRVTMKSTQRIGTGIAIALLALASPAWARDHGFEAQVAAGGGVTGFIEGAADQTKVGGAWDVRLRLRTPSPIGVEVGYVGSANG